VTPRAHFTVTDNIMDLSHVGFLHAAGAGAMRSQAATRGVSKVARTSFEPMVPEAPASPV